jgi:tetratricopeptide (TPR) repeat protein
MIFSNNHLAAMLRLTGIAVILLSNLPTLTAKAQDSESLGVRQIVTAEDAKQALARAPNSADAIACLGAEKYSKGDYKGSIADLTKALDLKPKDSFWTRSAYSYLIYSYIAIHDYPNALVYCKKNLAWEPRAKTALDAAKLCKLLNKPDEERQFQAMSRSLAKNQGLTIQTRRIDPKEYLKTSTGVPNASDALFKTGPEKYEAHDYKGAIADLSKAISSKPKDHLKPQFAFEFLYKSYMAIQDYQGALDCCKKRLELGPQSDVASDAAMICKRLGKPDEEKKFRTMANSLTKHENQFSTFFSYLPLTQDPKTVDRALSLLGDQLKKDPNDELAHSLKLRCHENKIKWAAALHKSLTATTNNHSGTQMDGKLVEALKDADDPAKVEQLLSDVQARLKTNPNDAQAAIIKDECIRTKEQRDGEISELNWILDHNSKRDGRSRQRLAQLCKSIGRPDLAARAVDGSSPR